MRPGRAAARPCEHLSNQYAGGWRCDGKPFSQRVSGPGARRPGSRGRPGDQGPVYARRGPAPREGRGCRIRPWARPRLRAARRTGAGERARALAPARARSGRCGRLRGEVPVQARPRRRVWVLRACRLGGRNGRASSGGSFMPSSSRRNSSAGVDFMQKLAVSLQAGANTGCKCQNEMSFWVLPERKLVRAPRSV